MTSPFPGMDLFIEASGLWEDFHGHLIEKIYDALATAVPAHYLVRTGERGYIILADDEGEKLHLFKPDVGVTTDRPEAPGASAATAIAEPETDAGPFSMRAFIAEEFRETFVEIYEAEGEGQLVTCVEVLSPTNKKANSPGGDLYQRKRQGLFLGHTANLVEIDLLRGGLPMPMVDKWRNSPYRLLVSRRHLMPDCKVWPGHSLRALPPIPVPLLKPDPDVMLELQPMVDAIYARSRYHRSIDYGKALTPALSAEESAWLTHHLQTR